MKTIFICHDINSVNYIIRDLKTANIIFVGNSEVNEEIINNPNIIIARNLKHNIEHEPKFLTFTAWYAIAKNNLYPECQHLCLFEYDVSIELYIENQVLNYCNENPETKIITFLSTHTHFNLDINKQVFDHFLNLKNCTYDIDSKHVWYPTTNHCINKNILCDFVDWFYPDCLVIKLLDINSVSWYHERLFSVYLTTNNIAVVVSKGITHVSQDSHIISNINNAYGSRHMILPPNLIELYTKHSKCELIQSILNNFNNVVITKNNKDNSQTFNLFISNCGNHLFDTNGYSYCETVYKQLKQYVEPNKVSVIIPSFNRFKYLLNAIASVKSQNYKNIDIIVINDCSTEKEYYEYDFISNNVNIIHLKENSKKIIGFACAGYVRTIGMKHATGKYIAFLDDDDIWLPNKLELQINAMLQSDCKMSCADGLIGIGIYNINNQYSKYNSEYYYNELQHIYNNKNSDYLNNGFPNIWNLSFCQIHNCVITSSVIIEKNILEKINYMNNVHNGCEDYDCWLRVLEHTNCVYVKDLCFYYDIGHGDGQLYETNPIEKVNKYFITFGGGEQRYIDAGNRLINQAMRIEIFDNHILYTDESLKNDNEFWNKHSDFIEKNKKGYGYWLWKSYIIKKTMADMKNNDVLLYLDSDCDFNINNKHIFNELFEVLKTDYIIGTIAKTNRMNGSVCIEHNWNKMDLLLELDMFNEQYLLSPQRQGGTNMFLVCDKTRELVNKWYDLACNYHLLDDSPSIITGMSGIIEHRHDQAIFSLLTKKHNIYSNRTLDQVIIY